jgi:hypothetical protein
LEKRKMLLLLGFEPRMFRLVMDLKFKMYLIGCGAYPALPTDKSAIS